MNVYQIFDDNSSLVDECATLEIAQKCVLAGALEFQPQREGGLKSWKAGPYTIVEKSIRTTVANLTPTGMPLAEFMNQLKGMATDAIGQRHHGHRVIDVVYKWTSACHTLEMHFADCDTMIQRFESLIELLDFLERDDLFGM